MLFAGIDVGQSGTTAAIGDGKRVLARGYGAPGDEIGADAQSTRLRDALEGALADATRAAHLPSDARFDAIVAGISGYEGHTVGTAPQLPSARVVLMHDAPIAHAAIFGAAAGVAVIAGTGSVAYTVARDGRTATTGGWGYLFGDEGSAFWIARETFARAVHHRDCSQAVADFFGCESLRGAARAFYENGISRERFATLAGRCIELAQHGDACTCFAGPVMDAAGELQALAQRAALDPPDATRIAFTGGLMRSAWFARIVRERVRASMPACEVVENQVEPADGALLLASRL